MKTLLLALSFVAGIGLEAQAQPVTGNLRAEQLFKANGVAGLNGSSQVPFGNLPVGTAANTIAAGITTPGFSATVPVNSPSLANRIITPVEYGAKCDGVTDDTTAFANMNLALNIAHGGTILLPPSVACLIDTGTTQLRMSAGNSIVGQGVIGAAPNASPYNRGYGLVTSQLIIGNGGAINATALRNAPVGSYGVWESGGVGVTLTYPFISPAATPGTVVTGTSGAVVGMAVTGPAGLASAVTVSSFTGTVLTLSAPNTADVPLGSTVTLAQSVNHTTLGNFLTGSVYLSLTAATGAQPGDVVTGTNIPTGTVVLRVGGTGILLSQAITGTVTISSTINLARTFTLTTTVDSPSGASTLTVPTTVPLMLLSRGTSASITAGDAMTFGSPGLVLQGNNLIRNLLLTNVNLPLIAPATNTIADAQIATWVSNGNGIDAGDDTTIDNVTIVGFNVGIALPRVARQRIHNVDMDNNSGLVSLSAADVGYLDNLHDISLYAANLTAFPDTFYRSGVGFFFLSSGDLKVDRLFQLGYQTGFLFDNTTDMECNSCFADGPLALTQAGTEVTTGFEFLNASYHDRLNGGTTDSNTIGVQIDSYNDINPQSPNAIGAIDIHDFTATQAVTSFIQLNSGSAYLDNFQVNKGSTTSSPVPVVAGPGTVYLALVNPFFNGSIGAGNAFTIDSSVLNNVSKLGGHITGWTDNIGPNVIGGATPTISSGFGTTPAIVGSSAVFRVTVGSGGDTAGVIAFPSLSWINTPSCNAVDETTTNPMRPTPTTTGLTITGTMTAADVISVQCSAY